jgi:hypothetical protein
MTSLPLQKHVGPVFAFCGLSVLIGQYDITRRFCSAKRQPEAATRSGNQKRQKAEMEKIFVKELTE